MIIFGQKFVRLRLIPILLLTALVLTIRIIISFNMMDCYYTKYPKDNNYCHSVDTTIV